MAGDAYTAVWVSHTSISDFLECPRAYYLKNVYKDPSTGRKVQLMSAPLALGQAVHEVLESLSVLKTDERFSEPLMERLERAWQKVSGKRGGFADSDSEYKYKLRAQEMLRRVQEHPGPIARRAVKIQAKSDLPRYFLSEEDNIILCGKVDWLEYLAERQAVHIVDFKTGQNEERDGSLQLPIYLLLVGNTQQWPVAGASYWYLSRDDEPVEQTLPNAEQAKERVLKIARDMKLARQLKRFKCPEGADGCRACGPMERIVSGEGELVGQNDFGQDIYILPRREREQEQGGVIL